jgi:hypothetical protein
MTDEIALSAAINVLRNSVENGRMRLGQPLDPPARGRNLDSALFLGWLDTESASGIDAARLLLRRTLAPERSGLGGATCTGQPHPLGDTLSALCRHKVCCHWPAANAMRTGAEATAPVLVV